MGAVTPAPGALAAETGKWSNTTIKPGQTLFLVTAKESGASLRMNSEDPSTLPAGWSAISRPNGLRLTAPQSANGSDYATVQVTEGGAVVDEFKVRLDTSGTGKRARATVTSTLAPAPETSERKQEQDEKAPATSAGERPTPTPVVAQPVAVVATSEAPTTSAEPTSETAVLPAALPGSETGAASGGWFSGIVSRVNSLFGG